MQSRTTNQIQIPLSPQLLPSEATSTQHGTSQHPVSVGGGPTPGRLRSRGGGHDDVTRSSASSMNHVKASRIEQYEAMVTHMSSYGGGPNAGFVVTETNWVGKAPEDSPIARFPNEVLIHMLSFLEPQALLIASLISKRFHALVNSPQAWRSAFVRFFPPPYVQLDDHGSPLASQDRRYFTRLCVADASENTWRKEYMQRSRLLRRLGRGTHRGLQVTYPARTGQFSVSHMAATFTPTGIRAVHASLETRLVTASDPTIGKIEKRQVPQYPLGLFDLVPDLRPVRFGHPDYEVAIDMGVNWVMDISEELGWIMGENVPDGRCYVHPYPNPYIYEGPDQGLSYIRPGTDSKYGPETDAKYGFKPLVTCVWIAKKRSVCDSTGAAVIIGNSRGFVRVFAIQLGKSCNTLTPLTSYCISPGIPIVQVKVDEDFLPRRFRQRRPWLLAINALGEVYYLRDLPKPGATNGWRMIPQTVRIPTTVYNEVFPVLSGLSQEEENEKYNQRIALLTEMDYSKVKGLWEGCHMDWFIEMDWAEENIIAGRTGSGSTGREILRNGIARDIPRLKRYHLRKAKINLFGRIVCNTVDGQEISEASPNKSAFGGDTDTTLFQSRITFQSAELSEDSSETDRNSSRRDEWMTTALYSPNTFTQITAYSIDNSRLARLTTAEDPTFHDGLPGAHGRLFAIGTNTGNVFVYNVRPTAAVLESELAAAIELPMRIIHTDSPQITTLGVSSLAIVHGGDDGLVQAWDPLASTHYPMRTLHSRFSARARRRLEQHHGAQSMAEADNQFAARCLILDPDPTMLRGIVALGTCLRYWNFSATDTVTTKTRKTGGGARSRGWPSKHKGVMREVIHSDERAMRLELERQRKETAELETRYGIASGRTALNEEEMLVYAQMISLEAFEVESSNRNGVGNGLSSRCLGAFAPGGSVEGGLDVGLERGPEDADLELASRLSLQKIEASKVQLEPQDRGNSVPEDASQIPVTEPGPSNHGCCSASVQTPLSKSRHSSPPDRKSLKKRCWEKVSLDALDDLDRYGEYGANPGWGVVGGGHEFEDDLELAIRLSLQEQETHGKGRGLA